MATKRVKMKTTAAGPKGAFSSGHCYHVDAATAAKFVSGGFAVYVDAKGVEVQPPKQAATTKPKTATTENRK